MRILVSVGIFFIVLFLCWFGGVDLTTRGANAAMSYFVSMMVGLACYTCPIWYT